MTQHAQTGRVIVLCGLAALTRWRSKRTTRQALVAEVDSRVCRRHRCGVAACTELWDSALHAGGSDRCPPPIKPLVPRASNAPPAPRPRRPVHRHAALAFSPAGLCFLAVTTSTGGLEPDGAVTATVSCDLDFGDALILGTPASPTLSATSTEPVDRWRSDRQPTPNTGGGA